MPLPAPSRQPCTGRRRSGLVVIADPMAGAVVRSEGQPLGVQHLGSARLRDTGHPAVLAVRGGVLGGHGRDVGVGEVAGPDPDQVGTAVEQHVANAGQSQGRSARIERRARGRRRTAPCRSRFARPAAAPPGWGTATGTAGSPCAGPERSRSRARRPPGPGRAADRGGGPAQSGGHPWG